MVLGCALLTEGAGMLDFILLMNGTLMMIDNMSWSGGMGFSVPPSSFEPFFVPYHVRNVVISRAFVALL